MYFKVFLWTAALVYVAADTTTSYIPNLCPQPTDGKPYQSFLYGHPDDCRFFLMCDHGRPVIVQCAPGGVWNDVFQTCVNFNLHFDTCTRENAQRECSRLNGGALLIPHPTECQRYYNCSNGVVPFRSFLGQYEDECSYPDVFDVNEKKCTSFRLAYCGPMRVAAKDPCDYLKNRCGSAHCEPCRSRLPSCVGLIDGIHEHPFRLWTPRFITCETERLVGIQTCESHAPTGTTAIFSPTKKACVSQWEIPRENGGLAPTCEGKPKGQYRTGERPDVYYTCPGAAVSYCGPGLVFNESSKQCARF